MHHHQPVEEYCFYEQTCHWSSHTFSSKYLKQFCQTRRSLTILSCLPSSTIFLHWVRTIYWRGTQKFSAASQQLVLRGIYLYRFLTSFSIIPWQTTDSWRIYMNTFYDSVFAIQKEKSDCLSQDRILPEISLLLILIFITLNLKAVERLKAYDIFQSFQLSLYTEVYIWMTDCYFY